MSAMKQRRASEQSEDEPIDLESLLSMRSAREKESQKIGEEILELLNKPTAKERDLIERFRSANGGQVLEFCTQSTRVDCKKVACRSVCCAANPAH